MEKATIFIKKTKKNKLIASARFENGKSMNLPLIFKIDESLNNKLCEVERVKGQIVRVLINGKELETIDKTAYTRLRDSANAPYNFIPLNKSVIKAEEIPDFDKYHPDKYTGYIDCELETITPVYIRGTIKKEAYKQGEESKNISDFFSPGRKLKIPGSTLRGMLRTLVEIVSWGKFECFEDKLLHYRGLADTSNLRKEYQKNMSSYNKETKMSIYKFNAGYLKKEGFDYFIIPAKVEDGRQFEQLEKRNKDEEFVIEKQDNGKYLVVSGKMENIKDPEKSKKHDWLINEPDDNNKIPVPEADIEAYKKDENRKIEGKFDPLKRADKGTDAPCFYVEWFDKEGKKRISFGHTGFFRLAYKKTIGEHIPDELKNQDITDISEAIFGKESQFATRIFFEDAELLPGQMNVLMEEAVPKILASPKPTTFQHYLEQDTDDIRGLNHYNTDANIRGYKLYWHKDDSKFWEVENLSFSNKKQFKDFMKEHNIEYSGYTYINDEGNKIIIKKKFSEIEEDTLKDVLKEFIQKNPKSQYTAIKPIRPNIKFKFHIRFENLSEVELGALLFALDLPENHYHKLGMGKPLGLGSIKITPMCFISNRSQRYKTLFHNNNWNLSESNQDIAMFKKKFEQHILNKISHEERGSTNNNLWETERLKKLKIMLDFENTKKTNWLTKTDYMDLGEFRKRLVLPPPEGVIGK